LSAGMASRADIVRRLFDLTEAGDVDEVVSHYHDDAEIEIAFQRRTLRGVDELRTYLHERSDGDAVAAEVTSLRFEEHDSAVLVTGRIRLRDDVRRSVVDSPGAWLFRFRGEKVQVVRGFRDQQAARTALAEGEP
jgi:ketosteroid isomerase-like protein